MEEIDNFKGYAYWSCPELTCGGMGTSMDDGWKKFCDFDHPILQTLTVEERREVERELENCGPVTRGMERGAQVQRILERRIKNSLKAERQGLF